VSKADKVVIQDIRDVTLKKYNRKLHIAAPCNYCKLYRQGHYGVPRTGGVNGCDCPAAQTNRTVIQGRAATDCYLIVVIIKS
jgi:hypothetical protein